MKAKERHHLKQNEFVQTVTRVTTVMRENRDQLLLVSVIVLVLVAIGSGYFYWRHHTSERAGEMLGVAMAVYQSPVAPASTIPGAQQAPGTFPTEQARFEAALTAFRQVADAYPSTPSGIQARYQSAEALVALGRVPEAETAYQDVMDHGGATFFAPLAKLGMAEALLTGGETDKAIKMFEDMAAQREGVLPVDGVLMQLAEAYQKAGKIAEARTTFKRVVDEFPESPYVADARQKMTAL